MFSYFISKVKKHVYLLFTKKNENCKFLTYSLTKGKIPGNLIRSSIYLYFAKLCFGSCLSG